MDRMDMTDEQANLINTERQRITQEKKAASLLKATEQDAWRRLVVKVISWTNGLHSGGIIKQDNKISPREWKEYSVRILKINVNGDKNKVKQSLEDTKKAIESFGGFEKH